MLQIFSIQKKRNVMAKKGMSTRNLIQQGSSLNLLAKLKPSARHLLKGSSSRELNSVSFGRVKEESGENSYQ